MIVEPPFFEVTSMPGSKEFQVKLKLLRPKLARKIPAELQVKPKNLCLQPGRPQLLGAAFDYLLRFELQRRAPHAATRPWVAEEAPGLIWGETNPACGYGIDVLQRAFPPNLVSSVEMRERKKRFIKDERAKFFSYLASSLPSEELEKRIRKIQKDSAAAVIAYMKFRRPSQIQRANFAAHIIRLAGLLPLVSPEEFIEVEEFIEKAVTATCMRYWLKGKRLWPTCRIEELVKAAVEEINFFPGTWPDSFLHPREVKKRAEKIIAEAKAAVTAYVKLRKPNRGRRSILAAHAIRLAKLDSVYHAFRLDSGFEEAYPWDVEDLLSMLDIVRFDSLLHNKVLLLNPRLSLGGRGGADADLITGDMLVDFKATERSEVQSRDLDQLLGYYLIARCMRRVDPTFPVINRLALYFCRHGHLWVEDTTTWTDNPHFSEVEEWFEERFLKVEKELDFCPFPALRNAKKTAENQGIIVELLKALKLCEAEKPAGSCHGRSRPRPRTVLG
jgi:hypothetical protein